MLLRILRFGALRVVDVMVPRADIIAVDESETVWELLKTFDAAGVSRVPLFRESLDDPRGMVHVKDVTRWLIGEALGRPASEGHIQSAAARAPAAAGDRPAASSASGAAAVPDLGRANLSKTIASTKLRRPTIYVPPSMPAANLLIRMQTIAHPHGPGGGRVRRHRRPCHHRGPGRADRRRHRGRARRGGGRQHRRRPQARPRHRGAHAGQGARGPHGAQAAQARGGRGHRHAGRPGVRARRPGAGARRAHPPPGGPRVRGARRRPPPRQEAPRPCLAPQRKDAPAPPRADDAKA